MQRASMGSRIPCAVVAFAVHAFARQLQNDNEHNRPLAHLVDLLGGSAALATATAAIDGEYGRYLVSLSAGRVAQIPLENADARARYERLRTGGIRVINPHAEVQGDPLFAGRVRQTLEAVERADSNDIARLLRALATYPIDDMIPLRERIYARLTTFGGAAARTSPDHRRRAVSFANFC
jgi:hypothetical protein